MGSSNFIISVSLRNRILSTKEWKLYRGDSKEAKEKPYRLECEFDSFYKLYIYFMCSILYFIYNIFILYLYLYLSIFLYFFPLSSVYWERSRNYTKRCNWTMVVLYHFLRKEIRFSWKNGKMVQQQTYKTNLDRSCQKGLGAKWKKFPLARDDHLSFNTDNRNEFYIREFLMTFKKLIGQHLGMTGSQSIILKAR